MGFNSVLFVTNDNLDEISRRPEDFATHLVRAMGSCSRGDLPERFSNFSVPYIEHADAVGLIAVGGNYAETVFVGHKGWNHDHHTEEGQIALLKQWADKLGFEVRKKRKKAG